jgi:hypothetical protein
MIQPEMNFDFEKALNQLSKATGATKARILKALGETSCEKFVLSQISSHIRNGQQQFDIYYNEKHELAKRKLIHRLYSKLGEFRGQVIVRTETSTEFGRFDIAITPVEVLGPSLQSSEIVVEIKTGLSLSLSQVERYLTSGKKVILVRIPFEQVVVLRPDEYGFYLKQVEQERSSAIQRLLNNTPLVIPCPECQQCPLLECEHNRFKPNGGLDRVTPRDLALDLEDFLKHLYPCLEKAVETILTELGIISDESTSSSDLNHGRLEPPVPSFQELSQSSHSPRP